MRFKYLNQWLAWLETLHPKEIDLGLERIQQVAEKLGVGSFDCQVVMIAGTNGKGSSVAALEAIYGAEGYLVGSYSSPHMVHYCERIRIGGCPVSEATLMEAFAAVDTARADVSLSYFEFGTLAALYIFQRPQSINSCSLSNVTLPSLDIVFLEVGLGGRLDAVNIVNADLALITTIDLDHQAWLGETREKIAREKVGIVRSGKPAVVGDLNVPQSVLDYTEKNTVPLSVQGLDFGYIEEKGRATWHWWGRDALGKKCSVKNIPEVKLLRDNLAAVLQVCHLLPLSLSRESMLSGVGVELPGRCERICGAVEYVLDVAHNAQAAEALARFLKAAPVKGKTYAIFGALSDKNITTVISPLLNEVDEWFLAELPVARSFSVKELEGTVDKIAKISHSLSKSKGAMCCEGVFRSPQAAYESAILKANAGDRLLVFGSFYTVGALREIILQSKN